jgi:hypothetical protein
VNLVDAESSSIENYRLFVTESRVNAVADPMERQLRTLFGLRIISESGPAGPTGPSTAQRAMAWTTLGLGVGALAAGIVFGLDANSIDDDLTNCDVVETSDGRITCDLTQVEARAMIDDGKSAATLSNVFIGAGLFLAVGSIILFTVTPGGDIDADADLVRAPRRFQLAPAVSADGRYGVSGALTF